MSKTSRLYLAAVIGMAAGCGDGSDTPDDPAVDIAFLRHHNPSFETAFGKVFAEYSAAHPKVKVTDTAIAYKSLGSTLLADLKANRLNADLVVIQPSWVCSFADNLADVPANVISLSEAQNTFFPAPLAGSTCDGKLKGLPVEFNLEYGGAIVNVDKYEAKFGRLPAWADWNAFIADAAALTEYDQMGRPAANGLDIDPSWPQPAKHIFFSQILQRGGSYWAADGKTFDFKTQAARESLTAMVGWLAKDKVMSGSLVPDKNTFVTTRLALGATGFGWSDPAKPLSVMGYCGTWGVPDTVGQLPAGNKTRYDFFPVPPMFGTQHKFVQNSGWALAVPKTSKHPEVAWDIVKSLALSPAAMQKWSATTGMLPALRANGTPEAAKADPLLAKVQPLLAHGQWVGYIPAAAIETVEGAIVSNFFDAVSGKKDIEQALGDMQDTANQALAQHR